MAVPLREQGRRPVGPPLPGPRARRNVEYTPRYAACKTACPTQWAIKTYGDWQEWYWSAIEELDATRLVLSMAQFACRSTPAPCRKVWLAFC